MLHRLRCVVCTVVPLATAVAIWLGTTPIWGQAAHDLAVDTPAHHTAPLMNRAPLQPTPFVRLPIGCVRPTGWLQRQLQLQRDGLTGAAEQLYDALGDNSGWLGGSGENWERGPYYVKGLIALGYTLEDPELQRRAKKWIEWVLQSQTADGFFGPAANDDWWPRMVVLFYLRDYYEATGDTRVVPFLLRYFEHQLDTLPERPLRDWGRARAGDNLDVVLWIYNLTGEAFLLDLARLLAEQAYPWTSIFLENRFYDFVDDFHPHHIVNVSQALKFPTVNWQLSASEEDRRAFEVGIATLERQYGRVDGQVSGTEMLSGRSSTDGVELCADVERILSNAIAMTILGEPELGDQLESVAYNSFAAHTSANLHQLTYYQLPNQVACTHGGHGFEQDYPNANMPGPHSGFPCCCYNWHFGWPKFVQHMWAATGDGGLAAMAYGPNRVTSKLADGAEVTITQTTDYPFSEDIMLKIELQQPAKFPLVLRIPNWCEAPEIRVGDETLSDVQSGTFHRIVREWNSGQRVSIRFPMPVRTSNWVNDAIALQRGPLAFALRIKERWQLANDYFEDFDEFEVLPETPWNYALQIDRAKPQVEVETQPVAKIPFSAEVAPVVLRVPAKRLPSWGMRQQQGKLVLGKSNHRWQPLAEASLPLEPDKPHQLKVECQGETIRLFVNDMQQSKLVQRDATFEAGAIGLRAYRTEAKFADVTLNGQAVSEFSSSSSERWETFGGTWSRTDAQLSVKADPSAKAVLTEPSELGDFTLEATVTVSAGGDAGFIFRASEPSDALDAYRGYNVGLACVAGEGEDAAEPPASPVTSDQPWETVELIPFGSTTLRVTYFPVLAGEQELVD